MTVSQLKSFHSFCSQSERPPPRSSFFSEKRTKRAPPLRPAPAVLAAAALPLLPLPFCVRPALAVHVPTCSLHFVHVHATMQQNFHLDRIGAWSYVNMAKLFVRYELA